MPRHANPNYDDAVSITKSDSTADPKGPFAAIYCGEGGDIKVTTIFGSSIVFKSTIAGSIIPVPFTRVWSTGTAATTPLGMYDADYHGPKAAV